MNLKVDRELVQAYLDRRAPHRHALTDAQAWSLYCLADGLGELPHGVLARMQGGWDWDHVLGSSREAWGRMAMWLREKGHTLEGPRRLYA